MGSVIAPTSTVPISFSRDTLVSDDAGGFTGTSNVVYECMATVRILAGSRRLEAAQVSLRQGYTFGIWIDPDYEPRTGDTLNFFDEHLTIQEYRYEDNSQRRYIITALEQVSPVPNG